MKISIWNIKYYRKKRIFCNSGEKKKKKKTKTNIKINKLIFHILGNIS